MAEGFKAASKADPQGALAAARSLADPDAREAALEGIAASGALDTGELLDVLGELSPGARGRAVQEFIYHHPLDTAEDYRKAAEALQDAPATRNLLMATGNLARKWAEQDWQGGWEWAASLPDPARSRRALAELASQAGQDQVRALAGAVADLPVSALSDDLFRNLLNRLPAGERGAWIRKLPADRAAWAESGGARVRE